jgi:hypothetical protein
MELKSRGLQLAIFCISCVLAGGCGRVPEDIYSLTKRRVGPLGK